MQQVLPGRVAVAAVGFVVRAPFVYLLIQQSSIVLSWHNSSTLDFESKCIQRHKLVCLSYIICGWKEAKLCFVSNFIWIYYVVRPTQTNSLRYSPIETAKGQIQTADTQLEEHWCQHAGKPWVLAFMWMPMDMNHPSKCCCGPSTQPHITTTLPDGRGPPSRTTWPDTPQTLLRNSSRNTIKGPRFWPGLQIPQIPIWSSICKACWSWSDPWRPHPPAFRTQRTQYKTPWCQTPQDSLRGL